VARGTINGRTIAATAMLALGMDRFQPISMGEPRTCRPMFVNAQINLD
jgi:hypothetical protein